MKTAKDWIDAGYRLHEVEVVSTIMVLCKPEDAARLPDYSVRRWAWKDDGPIDMSAVPLRHGVPSEWVDCSPYATTKGDGDMPTCEELFAAQRAHETGGVTTGENATKKPDALAERVQITFDDGSTEDRDASAPCILEVFDPVLHHPADAHRYAPHDPRCSTEGLYPFRFCGAPIAQLRHGMRCRVIVYRMHSSGYAAWEHGYVDKVKS